MASNPRDPRIDPVAGDVFRKWGVSFRVTGNHQGCVYVEPSLSSYRGWVGMTRFRYWAKSAMVIHAEKPTKQILDSSDDLMGLA